MKKTLFMATLALFASSTATAESLFGSTSNSADGSGTMYGGVSLGKSSFDGDETVSNWKAYGGYQFTPEMSVEAGYHKIGEVKDVLANGDDLSITGLSAAGLYTMPIADNLKAFGKAGIMAWDSNAARVRDDGSKVPFDGTDLLLGAGATYKLDENWGIRGEYEHVGGDLDANMYSVGAVFSTM